MYVVPNNSYQMIAALQYGPVAAAIDASSTTFAFYDGTGVITNSTLCGDVTNHAVLIVAYSDGSDMGGIPYFLAKNSYGSNWGFNGYVRIGIENGVGVCAIQSEATIPTLLLAAN
jgi:C1A family cysteine protease